MKLQNFCCILVLFISSTFGDDYFRPEDEFYPYIGPKKMGEGDIPYHVFINQSQTNGKGYTLCGGSIISPTVILTVASCFVTPSYHIVTVEAGSVTHRVSRIIKHPNYYNNTASDSSDYDIAIVELQYPLRYSSTVQPIELPNRIEYLDEPEWGNVTNYLLTEDLSRPIIYTSRLRVVGHDECQGLLRSTTITRRLLCAGHLDIEITEEIRMANKGAPIIAVGKLQGISMSTLADEHPHIFTRVAAVREWIRWKTGL